MEINQNMSQYIHLESNDGIIFTIDKAHTMISEVLCNAINECDSLTDG